MSKLVFNFALNLPFRSRFSFHFKCGGASPDKGRRLGAKQTVCQCDFPLEKDEETILGASGCSGCGTRKGSFDPHTIELRSGIPHGKVVGQTVPNERSRQRPPTGEQIGALFGGIDLPRQSRVAELQPVWEARQCALRWDEDF